MSTVPVQDIILLGLLSERPLHGYEIKQIIAQRMANIAQVAPGTIYYTLKKLEKRGLITSSSERMGNRPERRVYEITGPGRQELEGLLRASLGIDERPYYLFDVALYFLDHLDPADLLDAVAVKLERIEGVRRQIESIERDNPGPWPFKFEALRRKGRLLTDAMETWYRYLQAELGKRAARTKKPTRRSRKTAGG